MDYIPEEFKEVVTKHVYRNVIANISDQWTAPLILVISGPPGVGKTYQVHRILEGLDLNIHEMSGAEFENGQAGVPAKQLLERYDQASQDYEDSKKPAVLLIDDADTVIGNWGEMVQYTVNSQMVNKTLLDIADHPKKVHKLRGRDYAGVTLDKKSVNRIPIIMTCNDSNKFYAPLMRPGRTTIFLWNPDASTIKNVVAGIFEGILSEEDSFRLVDVLTDYSEEVDAEKYRYGVPISVYSDIKAMLRDDMIIRISNEIPLNKLIENPQLVEGMISDAIDADLVKITEYGKKLIIKDTKFV